MPNPVKQLFLHASGADMSTLRHPDCAVEHSKYVGIGATILSTAVLASLSGGYALYTVFGSYPVAICFGLLWGLIIFNLDRYIVSTIRSGRAAVASGDDAIARMRQPWHEAAKVLVRFVLALFISFIITKPLELRLFEREITARLDKETSEQVAQSQQRVASEFPEINRLEEENRGLREEVSEKERQRDALHALAMDEALGKSGDQTTGKEGKGPVFKERWDAFQKAEGDVNELKTKNNARTAANDTRIAELRAAEATRLGEAGGYIRERTGILERLKALSDLAVQDPTVAWTNRFMILLFVMLETTPLLVKLLSERGPYDEFYEAHELRVSLEQQRKMSGMADDVRTAILLGRQNNADLLSAGLQLSQGMVASMSSISAAQIREAKREIADVLINRWKAAELDRLKSQYPSTGHISNGAPPPSPAGRPTHHEASSPVEPVAHKAPADAVPTAGLVG